MSVTGAGPQAPPVAFVLKGYPRLSRDLHRPGDPRRWRRRGLDIRIVSLRHPTDRAVHPVHRPDPARRSSICPNTSCTSRCAACAAGGGARRLPGYRARAPAAGSADLRRDPTVNRVRRFGQALVLAAELPPEIGRLHAHFLHTPASVARYAAIAARPALERLGACQGHLDVPGLGDRARSSPSAVWVVTCTATAVSGWRALAPAPERVTLRLSRPRLRALRRAAAPAAATGRDGSDPARPVTILSVGRAVAKKGYDDLLDGAGAAAAPSWPGASSISAAARWRTA